MHPGSILHRTALALVLASVAVPVTAQEVQLPASLPENEDAHVLEPLEVLGTAEEELKQAPGVSIITEEDIRKRPPTNDLSDIIRRMPGVNLTGNSASGQYGNSRQIDLRGMGPENTLILIDGKPVHSRNSIRMGRSGERNTRGDSNWVPADAVERIEVIRGPAAARYGSGAAGGVVNIITKAPTEEFSGSVTAYTNQPEHREEGDTKRVGFTLSGPIVNGFSFRVYGNYNKTDGDDLDLNREAAETEEDAVPPAGREGVINKDINGLVRWDVTPDHVLEFEGGYSRQGNIYTGDRAVSSSGTDLLEELANEDAETNVMTRKTVGVTHRGFWNFGTSRVSAFYENTINSRNQEGLAGGPEGSITSNEKVKATLDNYNLTGEVNVPFKLGVEQVVTAGAEVRREELDDQYSVSQGMNGGAIPGLAEVRDGNASADTYAFFLENNIEVTRDLIVTPGVRFDHHSDFGSHFSPSLNASYEVVEGISIKGGIAQAFKAPNLYQSNPNYLYYTRGRGCPVDYPNQGGGCYVLGNNGLDPETSLNKEIGVSYDRNGWNAMLTYFHNDYEDKIVAGMEPVGEVGGTSARIFRWTNAPEAVVQGLEGNLLVPLREDLSWNTNFTYMIENENKTTGEPLSIIPEYTVNSWLDWQATNTLALQLSLTHYGEQVPRNRNSLGGAAEGDELNVRDPYTLVGLGLTWDITDQAYLTAGVSNLFDKRLFREDNSGGAGAATYNEPGRAYYVTISKSF